MNILDIEKLLRTGIHVWNEGDAWATSMLDSFSAQVHHTLHCFAPPVLSDEEWQTLLSIDVLLPMQKATILHEYLGDINGFTFIKSIPHAILRKVFGTPSRKVAFTVFELEVVLHAVCRRYREWMR